MSYLIDTNVISELTRSKPNKAVIEWFHKISSHQLYLSVLTLGELRKGIEQVTDKSKKMKLHFWLENELPAWFGHRMLTIDQPVADRWGRLLAEMSRPLPAIDSLIAATALHYDFCLVTRNVKDFKYPSLQVIDPFITGKI